MKNQLKLKWHGVAERIRTCRQTEWHATVQRKCSCMPLSLQTGPNSFGYAVPLQLKLILHRHCAWSSGMGKCFKVDRRRRGSAKIRLCSSLSPLELECRIARQWKQRTASSLYNQNLGTNAGRDSRVATTGPSIVVAVVSLALRMPGDIVLYHATVRASGSPERVEWRISMNL